MTADGIGVAVRRKEDRRFLTGTGRYTDDIDRFGQVYACFVRSPYAHASVDSIDTASALGMPGVLAVFGTSGSTAWFQQPSFAEREATEAASAPVSPLPGSVVSVHVAPGDEVHDGDLLVIVEAMKMEHRIEARATHTVAEVRVSAGDKVDAGTALVTFAD